MASQTGVLSIIDCSRGLSDWYPARLDENQVAEAWNVEFVDGAVCGRRFGSIVRFATGPGILAHSLFVYTPTTSRADDRVALAMTNTPSVDQVQLFDSAWVGTLLTSVPDVFDFSKGVDWASLHGKLFIAAKSDANRLHIYGPGHPYIRRTGFAAPTNPPVLTPNAGAGFAGVRQYRCRWVYIDAGLRLRSEPSPVVTYTPTGAQVSVTVNQPALLPSQGQNACEIEELAPDGSWYRMATASTWTDTLPLSAIATTGVLSEDVGDYTLQYSARWLTVDEDRLILGGSHDEESKSARVSWTPLGGQTGAGNDERLPSDVDGFLDFDMLDGGGLTGIKAWEGKVIVFKRGQTHQMVRSSSRLRAYLPDTLSRRHGAIPFSIVEGTDDQGLSCLYFLDPEVGPMQLGFKGLRVLCPQMQRAWKRTVNLNATQICTATFHADKRQVWWHIATGVSAYPDLRWMYSVESDGLVQHSLPKVTKASTYWLQKPTLAYDTTALWTPLIGQGDEPSMVVDYVDAFAYRAFVTTKAYQLGQLLRRFQIDAAVLEVKPQAGAVVWVTCRRDYGLETRSVPVPITAPAIPVELLVIPVDNSYMTEAITMQFEIGDVAPQLTASATTWQVHGLTLAWSLGSPSTGRG